MIQAPSVLTFNCTVRDGRGECLGILFLWDAEIQEHLAEHGITPEEFEEVVCDPDTVGESRSTGRPIAFGYTSSGRYLACLYELVDPDTVLPVTAYEIDD